MGWNQETVQSDLYLLAWIGATDSWNVLQHVDRGVASGTIRQDRPTDPPI